MYILTIQHPPSGSGSLMDIFVIWTHGHESLMNFVHHLNNCLPSIKFEADTSTVEVHFLDVTVSLDEGYNLHTDLYTKPTGQSQLFKLQKCPPSPTAGMEFHTVSSCD